MVTVVPGPRRTSRPLRAAPQSAAPPEPAPPEPAPPEPAPITPPADDVRWHRVDLERYEVVVGECVIGYVDVVGTVFVALRGTRYDRAVEIEQTLVFERTIAVLRSAA